jgi:hypothetical protein
MAMAEELVLAVSRRLQPHGFGPWASKAGDPSVAAVLHRPRGDGPRLFCAVAGLDGLRSAGDALAAAGRIRKALAREHKGLIPWPGRMGTFLVLVGESDIIEAVRREMDQLLDTRSRHVNLLLGAVLVDASTLRTVSDNVMGLLKSREEFAALQAAVEDWCRANRRHAGRYVGRGATLNVA